MQTEGPLLCSYETASGPYFEVGPYFELNPILKLTSCSFEIRFNIIPTI
jgi:hypothetical protein